MHPQAAEYIRGTLGRYAVQAEAIVEFGSFNVNGTARDNFPREVEYLGVDRREGPGVDVVCDARDFDGEERFDLVISSETLEHAEQPARIVTSAWRALRHGGIFVCTAAAPERPPHSNFGGPDLGDEHYDGIDPADLRRWLENQGFELLNLEHHPGDGDVYVTAKKP